MDTTVVPPPRAERELAPDLARGFMLLLIAMAYAGVYTGAGFGTDAADAGPLDRGAAFATTLLLDNRAFPMFAILFGYGMAWTVSRQSARGTSDAEIRRLLRRRGLFLLLFGFVHALLVFPGEILTSYGVAALATGWLLLRSTRAVTRAAVVFAAIYAVTVPLAMLAMSLSTDLAGGETYAAPGYLTAEDWVARLGGLPFGPVFIAIAYPLFLLVVLGYRAGRAGLLDAPASHRTLLTRVAAVGVAVSVAGALPSALTAVGALEPGTVGGGLLMAAQVLTGVFGGAGYAALFTLVALRLDRTRGPLTRAVAAVGERSLTFYILNSVLVAVVLQPDLVGAGAWVGGSGALVVATLAWLVSLGLAAWLARSGRPGPLDALMRRLVHGGRRRGERHAD
ncbi:DUF418 domain-containing protein [Nocardiopsis sp. CT-R113]|uniref:DUF418 domain-containing protein n=1 Tax=Nocardiopsis codii TaxID=3065942 RepID=A0ABU7KCA5_9ACTN|nr:DUF418 domain-containing protein [Nocardiopsis sp. CT-R113]MEE2039865.1 DUF418 domain-containing protein [Nocardiopsis sp. CT-R113]